jgi:hypothetical protein
LISLDGRCGVGASALYNASNGGILTAAEEKTVISTDKASPIRQTA